MAKTNDHRKAERMIEQDARAIAQALRKGYSKETIDAYIEAMRVTFPCRFN